MATRERPALASLRPPPPRLKRLFPRALLRLRLRFAGQGQEALLLLPHWLSPVSRLVVAVIVRCGTGAWAWRLASVP